MTWHPELAHPSSLSALATCISGHRLYSIAQRV